MTGYATGMIAERDARIFQLETDLEALSKTCSVRAASPRIMGTPEEGTLKYIAMQINKALHPEDYEGDDHDGD